MHRVYVGAEGWGEGVATLPPEASHHLVDVLRLSAGAEVVVFDGRGRESIGHLAVDGKRCHVDIETTRMFDAPPCGHVLFQALPKGSLMDWIVEKAVELGASIVVPVQARRCVARLDAAGAERKRLRWVRIARGAAEQCGTAWVPEIAPVAGLAEALRLQGPFDRLAIPALRAGTPHISTFVGGAERASWRRIGVLIGPEGDWTDEEIRIAEDCGAKCVSLGSHVLRTETAALFCLSVLACLRETPPDAEAPGGTSRPFKQG